ncbi:unnamed protein product [Soboliphyme baturini]|uniref:Uncharacterized protein n=1 Tax=Soboliphyme baturini TaxID=241478 RepID=A0A183ILH8_9BILA|nr:unnamed protein product [Soboliphyme baturini]
MPLKNKLSNPKHPIVDDPFPVSCLDLTGYWQLVSIEVEKLNGLFEEVAKLKNSGWDVLQSKEQNKNDDLSTSKIPKTIKIIKGTVESKTVRSKELTSERLRFQKATFKKKLIPENQEIQIFVRK